MQPMKPNGDLILKLSPLGGDPRLSLKRGQIVEKFFPVNDHKFVPKVKQISGCHLSLIVSKAFNEPVFCAACGDFVWGFGKQV